MGTAGTVAIAILGSSAFTTLLTWILKKIDDRKSKKSGVQKTLENVSNQITSLTDHVEQIDLSILRLTVINSEMPISERLIAGKKYIDKDGNGDVKEYYKKLESSINKKEEPTVA